MSWNHEWVKSIDWILDGLYDINSIYWTRVNIYRFNNYWILNDIYLIWVSLLYRYRLIWISIGLKLLISPPKFHKLRKIRNVNVRGLWMVNWKFLISYYSFPFASNRSLQKSPLPYSLYKHIPLQYTLQN